MKPALTLLATLAATSVFAAETPPSADAKPRFDVLDFQIDGNTVLDDETLERAVYPYMGPGKTVDDVEQARQSLEGAYRNAGYPTVVVAIPEQDVREGAVKLEVVEGSVENLHITGSRYYALGKIRDGVPALAEGQVPHMPTVQEQMNNLSQQSSDRNVTPIFRAGSTPGKMEVELRVKDELPLHGSLEMNSRNSEHTGYTRLVGSLRYDNLWQKFHSASLQYQVSPENGDEVDVWSGTYLMPTGWADTKLAVYGIGISSNTQLPGVQVGGSSVVGAGSIYGTRLAKPLPGGDDVVHSINVGLDYKSFDSTVSVGGADDRRPPISYAVFTAGYDGNWQTDQSVSALNLAAHFSLRGLGNDADEFAAKSNSPNPQLAENQRNIPTPNFLYLTADAKHQRVLPHDFRLVARGQGQASSAALISNEQFAAGGPSSVRGYHQTQRLGDHGVNLSLELHTPSLLPKGESAQSLSVLGFVDWAWLWSYESVCNENCDQALARQKFAKFAELASAGVGLRLQLYKHFSGELDWGYPFYTQSTVDAGQQRIDFKMAYEF